MPPQTIEAFRDHGRVGLTLEKEIDEAQLTVENLEELGIDLGQVAEQLQEEGVVAFARSFEALRRTIEHKMTLLGT
jgi:transaldolase